MESWIPSQALHHLPIYIDNKRGKTKAGPTITTHYPPENPGTALQQLLDTHPSSSVLFCSIAKEPVLEQFANLDYCHPQNIADLNKRYDLAVVANCLEHIDNKAGKELLGRLKNLISPQIWLLIENTHWPPNELMGLGFQLQYDFTGAIGLKSYTYNLSSYNFKRLWNNPTRWANPENWGKYWW